MVDTQIDADIAANPVLVYSKSYCPFAAKTKALFKDNGVTAKIYELDQMDNGSDI